MKRITMAEQIARALESDLMAGVWREFLPGGRVLAARYGANRATIDAALADLAGRGLVVSGGPRSRWRVGQVQALAATGPASAAVVQEVLLWVGDHHPACGDLLTREIFGTIRETWEAGGGIMAVAVVDMPRVRSAKSVIATLVKRHAATRVILHNAPGLLARAALATGLPVFQCGGEVRGPESDGVAYSLSAAIGKIIPVLASEGRRRILVALPAGRPVWHQGATTALREIGGVCAADPASWVEEVQQLNAQTVHDLWRRILPAKHPDAVVCWDVAWVFSLYSVAWQLGLRPGKDIVAVALDSSPQLGWLDPPPRILHLPAKPFIRRIGKWLKHPGQPGGFEIVESTFVPSDQRSPD